MTDETQPLILPSDRRAKLVSGFQAAFCSTPERFFSAPGRTEIGGNHTDHQGGHVLAAAVNLDTVAAVKRNHSRRIRVQSEGYPLSVIRLDHLQPIPDEANSAAALIRGVVSRFVQWGCPVEGFDAYITSTVLPGSGLASSAAFEVLLGTILNCLFFDGKCTGLDIAAAGQYAEHTFFKKPCGLMDQLTSAAGNLVAINLTEPDQPVLHPVSFDFSSCGHALCMVDSRASHAGLTSEYAAIPPGDENPERLFRQGAAQSGGRVGILCRHSCPAQPGRRPGRFAGHSFLSGGQTSPGTGRRLGGGRFDKFLRLVRLSGYSSYMYLQNVIPTGAVAHQELGLTLALCEHYLAGRGAYRSTAADLPARCRPSCPWTVWSPFNPGWTTPSERAPVRLCPSAHGAA